MATSAAGISQTVNTAVGSNVLVKSGPGELMGFAVSSGASAG